MRMLTSLRGLRRVSLLGGSKRGTGGMNKANRIREEFGKKINVPLLPGSFNKKSVEVFGGRRKILLQKAKIISVGFRARTNSMRFRRKKS